MVRNAAPRAGWRSGAPYAYLLDAERSLFAWEWLRRTSAYRHSWAAFRGASLIRQARAAHGFGLVSLIAPDLAGPEARPVWLVSRDPHVLAAHVAAGSADDRELFDIRQLAANAKVAFDDDDAEHWRLEVRGKSVRIDVRDGTLLGGPTLLRFELVGLALLQPKLAPLDRLVRAVLSDDGGETPMPRRESRAARWIDELRTADALADGATQQEIARSLYPQALPASGWRGAGDSYRLRIQRLVRTARLRLRHPLDSAWFR